MTLGKLAGTIFLTCLLFFASAGSVFAYQIIDFTSRIQVSRSTQLQVTETITAFFDVPKHGIYRNIPVIYRSSAKNINSRLGHISVTDDSGSRYKFSTSRSGDNLQIKIGDADTTLTGTHVYVISYTVDNVIQRFPDHDELYWNAVGTGWDVPVDQAKAIIDSPYARVVTSRCFGACQVTPEGSSWSVTSGSQIDPGSDLTFVLAFGLPNQLLFPDPRVVFWRDEGLGLLVAVLPAVLLGLAWFFRGRDYKFVSDNVYFQEPGSVTTTAAVFGREHLPLVYAPIAGLTPAEAGTILDMRVDLADVVAEISELARLGYIKIFKLQVDRFLLPDKADYIFFRTKKSDIAALKEHQHYLLTNLFNPEFRPSLSKLEKFIDKKDIIAGNANAAQVSKMSGKFYTDLNMFKSKLYENLTHAGYFAGRPDQLKAGGLVVAAILSFIAVGLASSVSLSPFVWPVGLLSGLAALVFGYSMGHRTAKGHAYYRQLVGLKYFVGKGKWRYEIAEKHLFLEEILPLAISLGVIGKLSADMTGLQLEPPKYMGNLAYVDFGNFGETVGKTLAFTPGSSSGGWSGGSGFSGGGGGGFGGGGGGSW